MCCHKNDLMKRQKKCSSYMFCELWIGWEWSLTIFESNITTFVKQTFLSTVVCTCNEQSLCNWKVPQYSNTRKLNLTRVRITESGYQ